MSTLTSNLSDLAADNMYVLDAGDGKGYVSSRLALQYNMKVLGIDASEVNTEGSQKRMKKLEVIHFRDVNPESIKNSKDALGNVSSFQFCFACSSRRRKVENRCQAQLLRRKV